MAYEKMGRSFPCLCSSGQMVAEWEEHDTWPSPNRRIHWSFACPDCAETYEFYTHVVGPNIVRKVDAEKHRELVTRYESARHRVSEAAAKYEQSWVDYVLGLPTKAAMHRMVASGVTYTTFAKHAKNAGHVEREARSAFHLHPQNCLLKSGIIEAEIIDLDAEMEGRGQEANEFWEIVHKVPVPFR